jgi:membrane protein involved in colicin uptake
MLSKEETKLKAEEDLRLKGEEEASLKAEEEPRLKAAEEAKLRATESRRVGSLVRLMPPLEASALSKSSVWQKTSFLVLFRIQLLV